MKKTKKGKNPQARRSASRQRPSPPPIAATQSASDAGTPPDVSVASHTEPAARVAPVSFSARVGARLGAVDLLLFRVGRELFALELCSVEEALERADWQPVPEAPASLLGMFELRGRLTQLYSPERPLGVALEAEVGATLMVRATSRRIGIAVDDVEDVLRLDLRDVREMPGGSDPAGVLAGVARTAAGLIALVDAEALVATCVSERSVEAA